MRIEREFCDLATISSKFGRENLQRPFSYLDDRDVLWLCIQTVMSVVVSRSWSWWLLMYVGHQQTRISAD